MTIIKKSRIIKTSCENMFNIVNDVEHYPEFLPYCQETKVLMRTNDEVQATLIISAAGMSKSFTTHNRLQQNKMIEIRLVDGPFNHLEGFWRFDEVEAGCNISFDLEFEFSSKMIALLFGSLFEQITSKMIDSFCERAETLYDIAP